MLKFIFCVIDPNNTDAPNLKLIEANNEEQAKLLWEKVLEKQYGDDLEGFLWMISNGDYEITIKEV